MRIEGVSWVGVRTEQYAAMAGFFRAADGKVFELCHDPEHHRAHRI